MSGQLRVAVVGAGPAGLYAADALVSQAEIDVRVDIYDRLPTPFGLLRYGVAPDHLKMKTLIGNLQTTLDDPRVRFAGGVTVGHDVTVEQLREAYHAVLYCFGAATDRHLGVPGEDLPGSQSATRFVNWYSGHPDVAADAFTLDAETAVVVGVGNVAVDVTRILLKDVDELRHTDIPTPVLDVLADSKVTEVHMLGRRGPQHAAFTSKELRELGELSGVDVTVSGHDVASVAGEDLRGGVKRNLGVLADLAARPDSGARRRLVLHFWSRPGELLGSEAVSGLRIERTELDDDGRVRPAGQTTAVDTQLVLRAVGYRGVPVPGAPFDAERAVVPTDGGRVLRDGAIAPGEYATGWIWRGPTGLLGTNRADAQTVIPLLLADAPQLLTRGCSTVDLPAQLRARGLAVVDLTGWAGIDAAETAQGSRQGRPRAKIATWDGLLAAAAGS